MSNIVNVISGKILRSIKTRLKHGLEIAFLHRQGHWGVITDLDPQRIHLDCLQHRWLDDLDFNTRDVDDTNRGVHGVGNHLKPGVDPLRLGKTTLSDHCQ